jgi:lipopolysaccharide/colanic/teichoic acid biosynthesis glycosyltransferase
MTNAFSLRQQGMWRLFDLLCACAGLLALSPVMALVALGIVASDGRPVLFRQIRVGRYGKQFRIWKFRTMRCGAAGSAITAAGDARITRFGARLRRFKLDELPQLFNVIHGEMSLVGPRPEAPEYVNRELPIWQAVLLVRPGITDLATLLYRDEEALLASSGDAEKHYRETVLPSKLILNLKYLCARSFAQDIRLILLTIRYSLTPNRFNPERVREIFDIGKEHAGSTYSLSSAVNR